MEFVLKVLKDGLNAVHVPYAYGFAIILLTVLVKAATYPLTKQQGEEVLEEAYASSASKEVPNVSQSKRSKRSKGMRAV